MARALFQARTCEVDKSTQLARHAARIVVVEVERCPRNPVVERAHQPAGLDMRCRCAMLKVTKAEPVERGLQEQVGVVVRDASCHCVAHPLLALQEFPTIKRGLVGTRIIIAYLTECLPWRRVNFSSFYIRGCRHN